MIGEYLVRLAIMLPLVCALVVAGLFFAKRYNLAALRLHGGNARAAARLAETVYLTPSVRLAVVDFADKRLLLAVTKQGAQLVAEAAPATFRLPEADHAR